jgi:hypothetical protein
MSSNRGTEEEGNAQAWKKILQSGHHAATHTDEVLVIKWHDELHVSLLTVHEEHDVS